MRASSSLPVTRNRMVGMEHPPRGVSAGTARAGHIDLCNVPVPVREAAEALAFDLDVLVEFEQDDED